ncbi:hypothetical protein ACVWZK_002966 [Bradyrhizobium sp. GM0.4]
MTEGIKDKIVVMMEQLTRRAEQPRRLLTGPEF